MGFVNVPFPLSGVHVCAAAALRHKWSATMASQAFLTSRSYPDPMRSAFAHFPRFRSRLAHHPQRVDAHAVGRYDDRLRRPRQGLLLNLHRRRFTRHRDVLDVWVRQSMQLADAERPECDEPEPPSKRVEAAEWYPSCPVLPRNTQY